MTNLRRRSCVALTVAVLAPLILLSSCGTTGQSDDSDGERYSESGTVALGSEPGGSGSSPDVDAKTCSKVELRGEAESGSWLLHWRGQDDAGAHLDLSRTEPFRETAHRLRVEATQGASNSPPQVVYDVRVTASAGSGENLRLAFPFPEAGDWVLDVAAGGSQGCFALTVSAPQPLLMTIEDVEQWMASQLEPRDSLSPPASFEHDRGETTGRTVGGTSERRCAPAAGLWEARSGDLVLRSADRYSTEWSDDDHEGKLLVIPYHQSAESMTDASLTIEAFALEHGPRYRYETSAVNFEQDSGEFSLPAILALSAAGEWVLLAQVNDDLGCFVLELPATD